MSAFEVYLRTGRRIPDEPELVRTKFNPWHDPESGRFTFTGQGRYVGRAAGSLTASTINREVRAENIPPSIRNHPHYGKMRLVTEPSGHSPLKAPDGAFYVLPERIDAAYLGRAISHLSAIDSHVARLAEFRRMYVDSWHPYFLDFKRFGTSSGPAGLPAISPIEYFSASAGKAVRSSPFEAAGNLFYGFIGSSVGFTNDELLGAAWLVQEGRSSAYDKYVRNFMQDSPQDVPHVNFGIRLAAMYSSREEPVMGISPLPGKTTVK